MNQPESLNGESVLAQYDRNLPRHVIGVARALNEQLMDQCIAAGHTGLRASFNQVLCRLDTSGTRIVDIANACQITQQAAGQIIGELEKLGYVKRKPDANDKRAKQLILTRKGEALMADCYRLALAINAQLASVLGEQALREFIESCTQLYQDLINPRDNEEKRKAPYYVVLCLSGLGTYCEKQLMELDKAKGHLRLKMSFAQVISHISVHGSLINDLAKINGVSKQAISQVVKEVEDLGYIERKQNPDDARSTKLFLTEYGMQLVTDSLNNISGVRVQFVQILRERRVKYFSQSIETLYDYFCSTSAKLYDESQRVHIEMRLQHLIEALYQEEISDSSRKILFSRSGNKVHLSSSALALLEGIAIRTEK